MNLKPPKFCDRHPVCGQVVDKALRSLRSLITDSCSRGFSRPTLGSIRELFELNSQRVLLGAKDSAGTDCIAQQGRLLTGTAIAAITKPANPLAQFRSSELPANVSGDLNRDGNISGFEFAFALRTELLNLGESESVGRLTNALDPALELVLTNGLERCATDRAGGGRDLIEGFTYAEGLTDFPFANRFLDALEICNIDLFVVPGTAELGIGATQQFRPVFTSGSERLGSEVTWSATGGGITQGGLYTAPNGAGVFTVTATSESNTSRSATARVTVVRTGCGG